MDLRLFAIHNRRWNDGTTAQDTRKVGKEQPDVAYGVEEERASSAKQEGHNFVGDVRLAHRTLHPLSNCRPVSCPFGPLCSAVAGEWYVTDLAPENWTI